MNSDQDDISSELNQLKLKEKYLEAINSFATILFDAQSIDEIVWTVTQNAIAKLGYYDCVIYLYDKSKECLVQRAAHGPKNPKKHQIIDPIELAAGEGIVGSVFSSGKGEIIDDTSLDSRYVIDDENRLSEISIPIFFKGETIGVIDSEHPDKGFFTKQDFELLTTIASLMSTKISQARATEELIRYKENLEEMISEKITELELANKILSNQNREKELLLKEIHHRVKNNMQIMISLVNLQVAKIESKNEQKSLSGFGSRIRSMAIIHELLYLEKDMSTISIDKYVNVLVQSILSSFDTSQEIVVNINIDPLQLDLDTSIPFGLIINELLTNSLKHAFNEKDNGEINIDMQKQEYILFEYSDNGPGFDKSKTKLGSFGLDLIEILSSQIGFDLVYENRNGSYCAFKFNN